MEDYNFGPWEKNVGFANWVCFLISLFLSFVSWSVCFLIRSFLNQFVSVICLEKRKPFVSQCWAAAWARCSARWGRRSSSRWGWRTSRRARPRWCSCTEKVSQKYPFRVCGKIFPFTYIIGLFGVTCVILLAPQSGALSRGASSPTKNFEHIRGGTSEKKHPVSTINDNVWMMKMVKMAEVKYVKTWS